MIFIDRTTEPSVLSAGTVSPTAYRTRQVVEALWNMQHGKCCYSEVKIPAKGHGKAVEHFRPQSVFRWRQNEWTNLLLVHPQCNGRKSDRFPVTLTDLKAEAKEAKIVYLRTSEDGIPAIIDPSDPAQNPERDLTYALDRDDDAFYGQVIPRDASLRGRETINVTGIDDLFFLRARKSCLLNILEMAYLMLLSARSDGNDAQVQLCVDRFAGLMAPASEFAGLAREFARAKNLDQRFGVSIPPIL